MSPHWLLWGEQYFLHLRNPFRNSGWHDVLVLSGVVLAVALGLCLVSRWQQRGRPLVNSPGKLFRELCAAHRLTYSERALLMRLSKYRQLTSPATLFVESGLWEGDDLGAAWQADTAQRRCLRERLFARV